MDGVSTREGRLPVPVTPATPHVTPPGIVGISEGALVRMLIKHKNRTDEHVSC